MPLINQKLAVEMNKVVNENLALRKQVKDLEFEKIARDVARHIDEWMDQPYIKDKSEWQDINEFSLRLTRYIEHRLK